MYFYTQSIQATSSEKANHQCLVILISGALTNVCKYLQLHRDEIKTDGSLQIDGNTQKLQLFYGPRGYKERLT